MGTGIHGGFGNTNGYKDTVAGDAVFASSKKLYFQYISKRKDIDSNGKYDVVAHCSEKSIMVRHGNKDIEINARITSKLIKNRKDYKEGKDRALGFMVGQVMKKTQGKVNPKMTSEMLLKELENR